MDKWSDHIDNKFGGCDVPFDGCATEVKSPEEQYHVFKATFEPVIKAIQTVVETVKDLMPVIKQVGETVTKLCGEIKNTYPNKRVVHLATHGKPRVRKKNMRRIMKWLEKQREGE
jgi:hypothetical protein